MTVPFVYSAWEFNTQRMGVIWNWFKSTGPDIEALYNATYRCNHKGGFIKDLLHLCYKFLLYAEPDDKGIYVYKELSDKRVSVKLHNLNWFGAPPTDLGGLEEDVIITELDVNVLFTKSSLMDKVSASSAPYSPETNKKADHAFRPNPLLHQCVSKVFRSLYEESRDKRVAYIKDVNGPVRVMSFHEFTIARLVPALIKNGVDTHVTANRNFWITAANAVTCAYTR